MHVHVSQYTVTCHDARSHVTMQVTCHDARSQERKIRGLNNFLQLHIKML